MTYRLLFDKRALREWRKLCGNVQQQFRKKLSQRLVHPHVPGDRLSGYENVYKIKLRNAGYRLVYEVDDDVVTVTVIVIGKRNRGDVYRALRRR
ncbi:addiction module RelE/StbE family toxin [Tamilnaduibacter salinus]|uniref:Addiction module RelE/StbE family toxin n=1 Tax=Tamilnaduibacter salinus TaxID=1484056 RepID=A0A2U1D1A0_9GAMM|nr:type II toxin-antitoxin system RelE/ParE family toxin [Tamilnaduibacter salinus]PVY79157.1 addiction module RelE/StbE family toxin [Tamilnaduibacter salinus]